jgi:hypothetical protein
MHFESPLSEAVDFHPAIAKAASRGLHDTAQPLTMLQGLLELTLMQAQTVDDYRESLTTALTEVARVTACFENVRQLVCLQQPALDVCDFSISQTVKGVVDELRTTGTKVVFSYGSTAKDDLVRASQGRVRQSLSMLISAVVLNSHKDVQVSIESRPQTLEVGLNTAGYQESPASSLEMARLVAASAGGEIRCSETSGSISLILPKAVEEQSIDKKGTSNHV